MKKILLIFGVFFFLLGTAQNENKIDSLKRILKTSDNIANTYNAIAFLYKLQSDIELLRIYADSALFQAKIQNDTLEKGAAILNIGDYYFYTSQYDSAIYYFHESLNVFKDTKYYFNIASVNSNLGTIYYYKNDYSKAIDCFKKAAKYQKLDDKPKETAVIYNNIAAVYYYQDQYTEAIEYYKKSLEIKESLKTDKGVAKGLNNIASVYEVIGDYDKAINYYYKAIKYCDKVSEKALKSTVLNNIAGVYKNWKQYDKALELYKQALSIKKEIESKSGEANVLNNMGLIYKLKNDFTNANLFFIKAKVLYKEIGDNYGLAIAYNNLGSISEYKKDYSTAILFYKNSANLSDSINSSKGVASAYLNLGRVYLITDQILKAKSYLLKSQDIALKSKLVYLSIDIYKLLSELNEKRQNVSEALFYYKKYTIIKDSLFSQDNRKQINELNTKYETEKKEKQILQQQTEIDKNKLEIQKEKAEKEKKEAQRNLFIIAFVLFSLASIFAFRSYKRKKETNILIAEQKLLRSQMNPHFISNALGSIQQYVLANNPIEGARYLSKFTALMRNIIESSRNENVSLETELETLDSYLSLQQLRFKNKFDFKINLSPDIEQEEILIPPMLAQPIIENAIKHAFRNLDYKGLIEINFEINKTDKQLILNIKDNGIGLKKDNKQIEENHISYATTIIEERIKTLNKNNKNDYKFILKNRLDLDQKSGTIAIFKLPLKYL